ncbi:ABC transporter ATP-binding protein [Gluconobacter sp.]|uniref:ABC transporter ATP-binding protein n=1 Tax=Gluconobacter sp. TaxID=1876758 RepID=UPI0039E8F314
MMDRPEPLGQPVQIRALEKSYGGTRILQSLSLDIPAGCFCTLLGASGSGKSTILKLIAGFETPDGGEILVQGQDLGRVPVHRRQIGMVFQNYALFPHMSVHENVAFGLRMRRIPREERESRVGEALRMVGLQEFGKRYPRDLSGGQQQRVALARALVIRPRILLMDEPLGALDRGLRQGLQQQIRDIQQQLGMTTVFVTHDQEEALQMSDMIVLMREGRIEQVGSPREIYNRPRNGFVASFLDDCNFLSLLGRNIGIRPQHLRVGSAALQADHVMVGSVESMVFLGTHRRITLRVSGESMMARLSSENMEEFVVGQEIPVGVFEEDFMFLEKNS